MINKNKIKVSDMVLIPQGVVLYEGPYKFTTVDIPTYAVVLEVKLHYHEGGTKVGNLLINYQDKQMIVDQEDVFKC
jgi:hypothetical protein